MRHINRFISTNDLNDEDRLKHLPRPPQGFPRREVAVLFITGDSETIADSLARRGFLDHHCCKLGSVAGLLSRGAAKRAHFIRAVESQKARWAQAGLARFLMVDYDDIWTRKHEICAFLGIDDPAFLNDFPERKTRNSG